MWQIFYFFQAEDGIRDYMVTGVKTCALPIFQFHGAATRVGPGRGRFLEVHHRTWVQHRDPSAPAAVGSHGRTAPAPRSEERRVGKGGRARRVQARAPRRRERE